MGSAIGVNAKPIHTRNSNERGGNEDHIRIHSIVQNTSFHMTGKGNIRSKFSALSSHDAGSEASLNSFTDLSVDVRFHNNDLEDINILEEIDTQTQFQAYANSKSNNSKRVVVSPLTTEVESATRLDKQGIFHLVEWMLRLSINKTRKDNIEHILSDCIHDQDMLTFNEFCLVYEEVATRVELFTMFDERYMVLDVFNDGFLMRNDTVVITDYVLVHFAKIWCTSRDIVNMKKKITKVFDTVEDGKMMRADLFELFDSMLITMRLLATTKKQYREIVLQDKDDHRILDTLNLTNLVDGIFLSLQRSGVFLDEDQKSECRLHLSIEYAANQDAASLTSLQLTYFFELIQERKRKFYNSLRKVMSKSALESVRRSMEKKRTSLSEDRKSYSSSRQPAGNSPAHLQPAVYSYDESTVKALEDIGNSPLVREKFQELDTERKGVLKKEDIVTLIQYVYMDKPRELQTILTEADKGWERETLDFDEFSAMLSDITLRIDITSKFNQAFNTLSAGGNTLDKTLIPELIDKVLYPFEKLGCDESERQATANKLVDIFANFSSATVTMVDLQDLVSDIWETTRCLKGVRKKFRELDVDGNGQLDGNELLEMAEWMLKLNHPNRGYRPTVKEVLETKRTILTRFNRGPNGSISMPELGLIHQDLLRRRRMNRSAIRYKTQVQSLIVELMAGAM